MKILVVQESDWITRGPHQQHQLFDRLSARGHEIRVIDYDIDWQSKEGGLFARRQVFDRVHKINDDAKILVIRPGMVRFPILSFISTWLTHDRELDRQVKEFKPDIIVGFGILNADLAIYYSRRYKIPFVYYWLDILHMLIPLKAMQWFGKFVEEEALRDANKVVVINESMKKYVLVHGANGAEVIGAGVDLGSFKSSSARIRERYCVKPDELLLFFMGYVYPFSGLEEVARQLPLFSNVKLMVVGDGSSFGRLNRLRDELQLGDRIITIDKKPYSEIPDYINAADVCILPADVNENIMKYIVPIKIYEYQAMGKPIICTELPGIIEEFGTQNGIVYVNHARDVIRKAIDIDYAELRKQSLAYSQNRDWEVITDKFERLLINTVIELKAGNAS